MPDQHAVVIDTLINDAPRLKTRRSEEIRQALLNRDEVALIDVREEAVFATAHPLFAVNIALSRLELDIFVRVPRRDTPITVYDDGEGLAERAVRRLEQLGYQDVALLEDGLAGWRTAGGELFQDVNSPSKAFGELVEVSCHTPSLSALEVRDLLAREENVVVLDARRLEEYQTMSIPSGVSVPGGELVLRAQVLAGDPSTHIVVNCAGRTRSIIGTQSLIDAGLPNPISALRNGTIGWTLAGLTLAQGQQQRVTTLPAPPVLEETARQARQVADRAGVGRVSRSTVAKWQQEGLRTLYLLDVRTPEAFEKGHFPGARSTPGGQLVQETDHVASVRGARIVLVDDDGVRANMTGAWLARMNWEVHVLDGLNAHDFHVEGAEIIERPDPGPVVYIDAETLERWQREGNVEIFDVTARARYRLGHIPGANWILRAELAAHVATLPAGTRVVLTCGSSLLAGYAWQDAQGLSQQVVVLKGGTGGWHQSGRPLDTGEGTALSADVDRYRRPYEGTDNSEAAMQAYLDWEAGLVDQLGRDGTHGFRPLR
ncbi:Rhodanese-related sulfurtransferase [Kushneria avicenniae]|uniref:Rhodanese-related sulfurtransferase n=1 Tax=Kushneria avicenniae TaxID=402385 RepID=A0A1I1LN66_9GAMM|nr:rhodanese-like domain-containing protein [Kushneria avicenniae]SFC72408.1 Rhodanese-related sulfurtransferase [Kushneria avicenniae]